jgi:hypothetical protein
MNKFVSFLDKQANELKLELATRNSASLARQVENNEPDFTHLELHADANVTPEGIELITQSLPMNRYITHLSMKNRSFVGTTTVYKIAEFAQMTICLTHLRLADCKGIDAMAAVMLFKALEHNVSVQQLAMPGNQLSCGQALASLLQHNFTLQAIDLSRNCLGGDFAPVVRALAAIPSANLKTFFLVDNEISEENGRQIIVQLEKNPKSATALAVLQLQSTVPGSGEPPLQKDLNDLLYQRLHGEPRPTQQASSGVDDAVSRAKQALSVVASRARGPSFQKTAPPVANPEGPSSHSESTNTKAACEDCECQTQPGVTRDVCLQTSAQDSAPAGAVWERRRSESQSHESELQRLREEVATERLARFSLAETLQYELECERANFMKLAAENEALSAQLEKHTAVVSSLQHRGRAAMEELRETCTEAYRRLEGALAAVENERDRAVQEQRKVYKMLVAMRTTRCELDTLLETRGSEVETSLRDALSRMPSRATREAGVVTDLTIAELEAYRLHRLEKHEKKRKARLVAQMDLMRKKGPPVDIYAVTLASELAALERAKAQQAGKSSSGERTSTSPHPRSAVPPGDGVSRTEDSPVRDDDTFVVLREGDEDDVDPSFAQMTKDRWMDERTVADCTSCEAPFGLLKRKHHCRRCGKVFCGKCCPVSNLHKLRMCVVCLHPATKSPRASSAHSTRASSNRR